MLLKKNLSGNTVIDGDTTITDPSAIVENNTTLTVNGRLTYNKGGGTLAIKPGAGVKAQELYINAGTVDSDGGTLDVAGTLKFNLNARLNVKNGSVMTAGTLAADNATVNISGNSYVKVGTATALGAGAINVNASTLDIGYLKAPATLNISNGSTVNIDKMNGGQQDQISFSGGHNIINITSLADQSSIPHFSGFSPTDKIVFTDLVYQDDSTITYYPSGMVIIQNGNIRKTLYGFNSSTDLHLEREPDGALAIVCFLAGSMIRTPEGDVAVETLRTGDSILVCEEGREVVREVVWAGHARTMARAGLPDDEAGYPVRILKDALAEGVPYKDMLITPEHCLYLDGRFVPARMLVNGGTIFYDRSIVSYDYYHVQTAEHSVIVADGVMTESYLDTGNRGAFQQDGTVVTLGGQAGSWADDAAAPLCVDRAFVEPLFNKFAARQAEVLGQADAQASAVALTQDPDLHLLTDTGLTVRPVRVQNGTFSFVLPSGLQSAWLMSRASRQSDVVGPFVDDRRALGVAVGRVAVLSALGNQDVSDHLTSADLAGWHGLEGSVARWTDGRAELPLPATQASAGMVMLTVEVRAAGPYLAEDLAPVMQAQTA
nr:Hint domain-containing protein [uncultured Acetobacter sp.]